VKQINNIIAFPRRAGISILDLSELRLENSMFMKYTESRNRENTNNKDRL